MDLIGAPCGIPPNGTNTQPVPQVSLLYQDTYNYSCLAGYETNDNITTECLADGSWSLESLPNCTSKLTVHASDQKLMLYKFYLMPVWIMS